MKDTKKYYKVVFETLNTDYSPRSEVAYDFEDYDEALLHFERFNLKYEHEHKKVLLPCITCKTLYECTPGSVFDDCEEIYYEEVQ